jgi:hypothetical protein
MGNPYKNLLTGSKNGLIFKTYDHASKLYISDKLARAPKVGFLYYINFTINNAAFSTADARSWLASYGLRDIALLVKKIDLPKFKVATETVNQYNRKTNIQTKITYEPINLEFHDDNSDITNGLWQSYYQYYYADSNYGVESTQFSDNKYSQNFTNYGLANQQTIPLFDHIDIFVLHQGNFSKFTLVNPLITQWDHDSLDQSDSTKILHNKMILAYESVVYSRGVIANDDDASAFEANFYDNVPGSISMNNSAAIGATANVRAVPSNSSLQTQYNNTNITMSQLNKVAALQQGMYNGPNIGYPIPQMPTSPVGVNIPTMPATPAIPASPVRLN